MHKKIFFKISIIILIIGIVLSNIYRPYIYSNKINDFGLADVIGSLISVIVFCTFVWSQKDYLDKEKNIHILLAVFIYAFLWEFLGYINVYGTFDIKDVFAACFSGLITFFIKNIVHKMK